MNATENGIAIQGLVSVDGSPRGLEKSEDLDDLVIDGWSRVERDDGWDCYGCVETVSRLWAKPEKALVTAF